MSIALVPEPLVPEPLEPGLPGPAPAAVLPGARPDARPTVAATPLTAVRRLARAYPVAAAGSALVLAGALAPAAPLRLALTDAPAPAVTLEAPAAYAVFSPFTRLADALCLLSTAQHAAVAATLLLAVGAWRVARRCPRASALRVCAQTTGACGASLVALVAMLAVAVFAPRPMARLASADADWVRVDFHTHTAASHDVPAWFTPARRRAWHAAAGYDVAYVSDHKQVWGARAAAAANPARSGDGLVVLPAIESWWHGVHVVVLGEVAADPAFLADEQVDRALPAALASGRLAGRPTPVALAAIPDNLLRALTPEALAGAPWLRGMELVDGAPRAIAQHDREGGALAARAAEAGLVPLAGTNHHGWGRTAVAWNLVRVPGWQRMTPAALDARLQDVLRRGDTAAVRLVARARPEVAPAGVRRALSLAATGPALAWGVAAELPARERAAWLAWLWLPAALGGLAARRAAGAPNAARRAPAPPAPRA